ncbi:alanine/glycine:cation symporter family protein [Maribacter sp. PR1]|uniref:Alanine/glycine:cation symporter family protein n=1 Tax=Maribacter cobaltidurans TaxID=1178778 RepID=A0ABU7IYA1_9FLAO|nr:MULTISPECIES: alanine/glycine:cation symporter family protein [Maribacter]MDC6390101.1 alanine/glycine:cation symporter family protein [Maribacter sp. PR1]MEE1977491.1 alanine/glycine:cation symporter family protein [Maribacter cobaltidurans]
MKYKLLSFCSLMLPFLSMAQEAGEMGIDEKIDKVFGDLTGWFVDFIFYQIPFSENIKIYWVLFPLILGAGFFTIYFRFINFTGVWTAIKVVMGKYEDIEKYGAKQLYGEDGIAAGVDMNKVESLDKHLADNRDEIVVDGDIVDTIRDESSNGEVSHFQALTAALSATVGLGNIAGVAVAVSIGGAGATFWMIVAGLLGMASKFVECTLGVKYRDVGKDGTIFGGPMYYLNKGLKNKTLGKVLAGAFAVMCIGGSFGGGNMFQVNQAVQLFESMTGGTESFLFGYRWAFGVVMAILVGIVIIGGIKSIAKVTDKIVPIMVVIYVGASLFVLIARIDMIGWAFNEIIQGAFAPIGIVGGAVGVMIQGFRRAAFSNEAGVGSASIAHSAVRTKYPASEGLVALLEPFIDTVLVCTMTALVLIITGNVDPGNAGLNDADAILLTSGAFGSVISWFPYVLTVAVVLFAFSTQISWSYYGYQAWAYLFGRTKKTEYTYKIIFCLFVIVGASASMSSVIGFSDAMIFGMMVPNMVGIVILAPKVKGELKKYMDAIKLKVKAVND